MSSINSRLRKMAELDSRLEELEEFSDSVREYQDSVEEVPCQDGLPDEDDEDYLMLLERKRVQQEVDGLKGTLWEPSLLLCWGLVFLVTTYVVFAIITADREDKFSKDEL